MSLKRIKSKSREIYWDQKEKSLPKGLYLEIRDFKSKELQKNRSCGDVWFGSWICCIVNN